MNFCIFRSLESVVVLSSFDLSLAPVINPLSWLDGGPDCLMVKRSRHKIRFTMFGSAFIKAFHALAMGEHLYCLLNLERLVSAI